MHPKSYVARGRPIALAPGWFAPHISPALAEDRFLSIDQIGAHNNDPANWPVVGTFGALIGVGTSAKTARKHGFLIVSKN